MPDILAFLTYLIVEIDNTTYRQFSQIISSMLAMSGRITMKGISQWAGKGGSYRTVQRFFYHPHNWANNDVVILSHSLFFRPRNLCHCQ